MTITTSPYLIRPMSVDDLPQIAEIEAQSFPSAWPSSAYKRELQRNKLARYIVAVQVQGLQMKEPETGIGRVMAGLRGVLKPDAPPTDFIAGFLGFWFMVDEGHIVTVAVRESERRKGVGELMLLSAFDLAQSKGLHVLTLECRVSNTAAQAMYEKYGFERVGIRKRYYTDNNEDAVIMTTPSTEDPAYNGRIDELRHRYVERWGASRIELESAESGRDE